MNKPIVISSEDVRNNVFYPDVQYAQGIPYCRLCSVRFDYEDGWIHNHTIKAGPSGATWARELETDKPRKRK